MEASKPLPSFFVPPALDFCCHWLTKAYNSTRCRRCNFCRCLRMHAASRGAGFFHPGIHPSIHSSGNERRAQALASICAMRFP